MQHMWPRKVIDANFVETARALEGLFSDGHLVPFNPPSSPVSNLLTPEPGGQRCLGRSSSTACKSGRSRERHSGQDPSPGTITLPALTHQCLGSHPHGFFHSNLQGKTSFTAAQERKHRTRCHTNGFLIKQKRRLELHQYTRRKCRTLTH